VVEELRLDVLKILVALVCSGGALGSKSRATTHGSGGFYR
jgi:hypothetical protein